MANCVITEFLDELGIMQHRDIHQLVQPPASPYYVVIYHLAPQQYPTLQTHRDISRIATSPYCLELYPLFPSQSCNISCIAIYPYPSLGTSSAQPHCPIAVYHILCPYPNLKTCSAQPPSSPMVQFTQSPLLLCKRNPGPNHSITKKLPISTGN